MALGDRYILYVNDVNDGYRYRARIQQEGAASAIELRPVDARNGAAELFGGEQGTQDPAAPLVRSSMSFRVLKTQGALVSVFGEAMDAFPVIWERQLLSANPTTGPWSTIWRGFLHTRYYEDAPDAWTDEVVLKAHDGIELLKTREYVGITDSDSVWTTLKGILGGLGFGFGYETIMRWYPYLSSQRTSRIIEYLYTQDARWGDENEPDLRLSQYAVLEELVGRFEMQLVQSKGLFRLRQRANLTGDQAIVEVYNSSGTYTGTGTVDVVNVDPITELQGRPRSFLSKIQQAQSTHEHGKIDNLLHNGSFEAAIGSEWTQHALPAGLSANTRRILYDDITGGWDELPDSQAENSYAYRISLTGAASVGSYDVITQQGAGTISGLGGNRLDVRFMSSLTNVTQTFKPEWRVKVGGFYLQAKVARIQASSLKGEGATLVVDAIESGGSGVVIPAGQTLWIVERTDPNVDLVPWITTFTPEEDIEAGQVVIKGTLEENIDASDDIGLLYFTWTTTQTTIRYPYFPAPLCTYVQSGTDVPRWDECRVIVPLKTSAGAVVSGIPEITFGAYVGAVVDFANLHYVVDEVSLLPVDASNRPLDRAITASSAGAVHDDTEILTHGFLTGDGPTRNHRARLSVLDGSGARQEITGGWKNGPYTSGEASTQLSIDALHTRLSIRQRKKHLAVRRITFLLHEGESIWPHHVITRGGVNYTIGRYERRFGTGQVYTELIELFQGSDDGIADAVVQEGPSAQGTGGRTLLAVSSGGGGGATDWASITGKPPLVNTFNTRSGDITLTSADVTGALGYDPASKFVDASGDTMTGGLTMASGADITLGTGSDLIFSGGGILRGESGEIHAYAPDGTNHGVLVVNTLRVLGTIDQVNTNELRVSDQYIVVAQGQTGVPSLNGGLYIERGSSADAYMEWDEGLDRWGQRLAGGTFEPFARTNQIETISATWTHTGALYHTGDFGSTTFASGFTGHGHRITSAGDGTFRNLTVRETARFYELEINKIRSGNGSYLFSDGAKVTSVEYHPEWGGPLPGGYRIFFDPEVGNPFVVGDKIRAQAWTGREVYVSEWTVGASATDRIEVYSTAENNGVAPEAGMEFVRVGSSSNANRRGLVYITSSDDGAPYIDVLDGLTSHADWGTPEVLRMRAGNLAGIGDTVAGQTVQGYGLYTDNFFGRGVFAFTRGYAGENGEVLLGSSFAPGDYTAGRIMVGTSAGGTALVSLRGPSPGGDTVQLYGSSTGRGLLMQYAGVEYIHLGWKWNGSAWVMANTIGPWTFDQLRFRGNDVYLGKNLEVLSNTDIPGLFLGTSTAGTRYLKVQQDADNYVQIHSSPDGVGFGITARVGGVDKLRINQNEAVFSGSLTASTITGTVTVSGGSIVAGGGNVTLGDDGIVFTQGDNNYNGLAWHTSLGVEVARIRGFVDGAATRLLHIKAGTLLLDGGFTQLWVGQNQFLFSGDNPYLQLDPLFFGNAPTPGSGMVFWTDGIDIFVKGPSGVKYKLSKVVA